MNTKTQARRQRIFALSLCLLTVAACSGDNQTPIAANDARDAGSVPATNVARHSGVLNTKQGVFRFTPRICGFHKENGIYDIEIEGPGQAPDGEKFYFELSSTGNEVAINLGVDTRYKSADRKLVAGSIVSEPFTLDVSGQSLSVPKLVFVDSTSGQRVDDSASLKVDCTP